MWKPDEVNGSNKGLCQPPWGQQPLETTWCKGHPARLQAAIPPTPGQSLQPAMSSPPTHVTSGDGYGWACGCPPHRAQGTPGQFSSDATTGTSKEPSCRGCSSHDSNTTFILKRFPPPLFKIKQKALTQANFLPVKREHCQRV